MGSEIRSLNIKNHSNEEVELEVTSIFNPVLSKMEDDISHPAFNNLFLKYSLSKEKNLIIRRSARGSGVGLLLRSKFN